MDNNNNNRCWCCGSKLIDSSRLKNKRLGYSSIIYKATGVMICPNECPSKEEAEKQKQEVA